MQEKKVNYAKKGWIFFGLSLLSMVVLLLVGQLMGLSEKLRAISLTFVLLSIILMFLSAIIFFKTKRVGYIIMASIEILTVFFLLWILLYLNKY